VTRSKTVSAVLVRDARVRSATKTMRQSAFTRLALYSAVLLACAHHGVELLARVQDMAKWQQVAVMQRAVELVSAEHPTKPGFMLNFPFAPLCTAKDLRGTIKTWYANMCERGSVADDHVNKSGRPVKVQLPEPVKALILHTIADNLFLTLKDMAAHPSIAPILKVYDCTISYVIRRLRAAGHSVSKCMTLEYKYELTAEVLEKRVQHSKVCSVLFKQPMNSDLAPGLLVEDCVIWIDQKCQYIKPDASLKLWGLSDTQERIGHGGTLAREMIASHKLRLVRLPACQCLHMQHGCCLLLATLPLSHSCPLIYVLPTCMPPCCTEEVQRLEDLLLRRCQRQDRCPAHQADERLSSLQE
jgi:hypothetical protein